MERGHAAFTRYVEARLAEDPGALLYGVTTGPAAFPPMQGFRRVGPDADRLAAAFTQRVLAPRAVK
jgi:hypothetical protein